MNKYLTKQEVLTNLGIKSMSESTIRTIPIFISLLPQIDPEVCKELLMALPEFKEMMTQIFSNYKETLTKRLDDDSISNKEWRSHCKLILDTLQRELNNNNISENYRRYICECMFQIIQLEKDKDNENKNHTLHVLSSVKSITLEAVAYIGIAVVAAAILASYSSEGKNENNFFMDSTNYNI